MLATVAEGRIWWVSEERRLAERPRCKHCGDAVGVYEPLVVRVGSQGRETSLAAEPELTTSDACLFHRACYELLTIEGQVE